MSLPGDQRSKFPDDCGHLAGAFAEAIRDGDMDLAWSMLSKETRGMRMGVWATRNDLDMQVAYRPGTTRTIPCGRRCWRTSATRFFGCGPLKT